MTSSPSEQVLGDLADREAVRDLARRYAHGVWRRDVTAVVDVFTDDGYLDVGTMPPAEGRDALVATFEQILGGPDVFRPFVHQHLVEVDGDVATGTCYLEVWGTVDGRRMLGGGYYDDRYRRTADGWRIASRQVTMLPMIPLDPPDPEGPGTPPTRKD